SFRKGDFDRASEHCEKSYNLYKEIGDPHGVARTLLLRGLIYHHLERFTEAIEVNKEAIRFCDKLDAKHGMATVYNNMGLTYIKLQKYEEAIRVLTRSMELSESTGDRQLKSYSLTILAMAHSAQQ